MRICPLLPLLAVLMSGLRPGQAIAAEFKFASVISDHAVLQRDVEAPVWGFADTGAVVRVSLFKEGDRKPLAERTATTDDKCILQRGLGRFAIIMGL